MRFSLEQAVTFDSCSNQAWLLKNSLPENAQKKLCVRMPYKRLARFGWTFSIPQILAVLRKMDFFNTHRRFHSQLNQFLPNRALPLGWIVVLPRQLPDDKFLNEIFGGSCANPDESGCKR